MPSRPAESDLLPMERQRECVHLLDFLERDEEWVADGEEEEEEEEG